MVFEWDTAKAAANLLKHGVAFEDAVTVFRDPLHRSRQDRYEDGQERWQTFGFALDLVLIMVAHTFRDTDGEEVIRIISARRATRQERRDCEQA